MAQKKTQPQISVRGETYRAIREVAHARDMPVGRLVDQLIVAGLDAAERSVSRGYCPKHGDEK